MAVIMKILYKSVYASENIHNVNVPLRGYDMIMVKMMVQMCVSFKGIENVWCKVGVSVSSGIKVRTLCWTLNFFHFNLGVQWCLWT